MSMPLGEYSSEFTQVPWFTNCRINWDSQRFLKSFRRIDANDSFLWSHTGLIRNLFKQSKIDEHFWHPLDEDKRIFSISFDEFSRFRLDFIEQHRWAPTELNRLNSLWSKVWIVHSSIEALRSIILNWEFLWIFKKKFARRNVRLKFFKDRVWLAIALLPKYGTIVANASTLKKHLEAIWSMSTPNIFG